MALFLGATLAGLPPSFKWPDPPTVSCKWNAQSHSLDVSFAWTAKQPVDVVELGFAEATGARPLAVYTSVDLTGVSVGLDELLPSATYYLSARGHSSDVSKNCGSQALSRGSWGRYGEQVACTTGGGDTTLVRPPSTTPLSFEAFRISEGTVEVDYMAAHDSGDLGGDAMLITGIAQYESLFGSGSLSATWLGLELESVAIQLGCVESLPPELPGNVTTGGDPSFTDYLSCNSVACGPYPGCGCTAAVDRLWGNLDISPPVCHDPKDTKTACTHDPDSGFLGPCTCSCDAAHANSSQFFTGMMPVYVPGEQKPIGRWYSHPFVTYCPPGVPLGTLTGYGVPCTWQQRAVTRIVRGWQMFAAGFNATAPNGCTAVPGSTSCKPEAAQVRQNAAVIRRLFEALPLAKWNCA